MVGTCIGVLRENWGMTRYLLTPSTSCDQPTHARGCKKKKTVINGIVYLVRMICQLYLSKASPRNNTTAVWISPV